MNASAVNEAIRCAEDLLPGVPSPDDQDDPRWQAIIAVGEHVESHPEEVWRFVLRWGGHEQEDLRTAIATCLLEHLLEHHFDRIFPRVEAAARDRRFAYTFRRCWKFGQSELPGNAERFDRLRDLCRRGDA